MVFQTLHPQGSPEQRRSGGGAFGAVLAAQPPDREVTAGEPAGPPPPHFSAPSSASGLPPPSARRHGFLCEAARLALPIWGGGGGGGGGRLPGESLGNAARGSPARSCLLRLMEAPPFLSPRAGRRGKHSAATLDGQGAGAASGQPSKQPALA